MTKMTATSSTTPARRPVRWRRRIVLGLALLVLLAAAGLVGYRYWKRQQAEQALEAALAEADRDEAGWQLEAMEARRAKVPDADNAALPVAKAAALVPDGWAKDFPYAIADFLPPTTPLDQEETTQLRELLKNLDQVVPLAQQALPLKQGYVAVAWTPDTPGRPRGALERVRTLALFLRAHAELCSKDGKHDEAWRSALTILAVARAIGDDPHADAQRNRLYLREQAAVCLERVLANAPLSIQLELLREAAAQLTEEAKTPVLLQLLRGERAFLHRLLTQLEADAGSVESLQAAQHEAYPSELNFLLRAGSTYKYDHAWLLDYFNKAIAIAKLPTMQQPAKFKELEATVKTAPPLARLVANDDLAKQAEWDLRTRALLDCAAAAIAVEQFRVKNQAWPATLEEAFGPKVEPPVDVFDGKPLRYRKTPTGVVVYSVGPAGTYAGDALDALASVDLNVRRYEFRLWNPENRGKGPRPPRAGDEEHRDGGQ
jgi:hypothetical protein